MLKSTSWSAVVVAAAVAVVATMFSRVAGLPATTHEDKKEVNYRHYLKVQHEELKSLGCQPKPGKVTIMNELQNHDYLLDEEFFPQVVSVSRCWESCTFCGHYRTGTPIGRCLPDPEGIIKRPFYVYYFKGERKMYRRVLLTEHTSCKCS